MREVRRSRGFTVVELLVVIGLMAIVAMIASVEVSNAVNKANLDETGGAVRGFLDAAKAMTVREGSPVTVSYTVVSGKPTLQARTPAGATRTLTLPGYVKPALNAATVAPRSWPVPTPAPWVTCDTLGRTLSPSGAQVTAVQTFSLTHRGMLDEAGYPKVRPRLRYDIEVFPLWQTNQVKRPY